MSPKGTVRVTAALSRLRAWPTPVVCLASSKATSMDHNAEFPDYAELDARSLAG